MDLCMSSLSITWRLFPPLRGVPYVDFLIFPRVWDSQSPLLSINTEAQIFHNLSSAVDRAAETFLTILVPCQIQLHVGFSFFRFLPVGLGSICICLLVDLTLLVCFLFMFKFSQKLLVHEFRPPITFLIRFLNIGLDHSWAWRRLQYESALHHSFLHNCIVWGSPKQICSMQTEMSHWEIPVWLRNYLRQPQKRRRNPIWW